jgi:PQQ-dependent catabolism-associated beta-propeller protein
MSKVNNNVVATCSLREEKFKVIRIYLIVVILLLCATQAFAEPSHRAFVTNEKDDTVSVIDTLKNAVIATIPVGKRPRGIGLAPDGREVYVAVSAENAIVVFDPISLEILRRFNSGDDPETFDVHPNGNIYISNEEDAKASVFTPEGKLLAEIPVGLEPEGVAIAPDGSKVVVTSESTNMLHVITIPEHHLIGNILVGARPRAATFSADSKTVFSSSEVNGEIKRINMDTFETTGSIELGDPRAKPKDLRLSKDGKKLYVAGGRANRVYVIDAQAMTITGSIPVGKRVWGLAMNSNASKLYTTDGVSGTVSVIDTATDTVIATIAVGSFPWGVVVDD